MTKMSSQKLPVRPSEAGFTLIESLIAIIVLVFGIIAIANLFLVATTSNSVANTSTAATTQATEVLERLKAIPFNNLIGQGGQGDLDADAGSTPNCDDTTQDCVVVGNYNAHRMVPGVGSIVTRWSFVNPQPGVGNGCFITVRSEGEALLFSGRTRAEFTTYRTSVTSSSTPGGC